jgi:hypothetical protein
MALAFGAALRMNRFHDNRSRFTAEAGVALNVLDREIAGLLRPLDHSQAAPVGWLMLIKPATLAFGGSEPARQAVPRLAGLASLALLYPLGRRFLAPAGSLLACFLLATTDPAIHWSVSLKQYSIDLLIAVPVTWAAARINWRELQRSSIAAWMVFGPLAVWVSLPAAFVLAAMGAYSAAWTELLRNPRQLARVASIAAGWLLGFAALCGVSLKFALADEYLRSFWGPHSDSAPVADLHAIDVTLQSTLGVFRDPVGVPVETGGSALYLLGTAALLMRAPRTVILLLGLPS